MTINLKIKEILKEFGILPDDGIPILLSLYYGFTPSYIPQALILKMNLTKIVVQSKTGLQWNIPLFEGVETAFEWVLTEYLQIFETVGKNKFKRECVTRMKKLFRENPEIRKEEIIGATEMYINNTDPKYVRNPHYFIEKGSGGDKTQDILEWVEKYQTAQNQLKGRDESRQLM